MSVNSSNGLVVGDFSFTRINTYFSVYDDLVLNFHLIESIDRTFSLNIYRMQKVCLLRTLEATWAVWIFGIMRMKLLIILIRSPCMIKNWRLSAYLEPGTSGSYRYTVIQINCSVPDSPHLIMPFAKNISSNLVDLSGMNLFPAFTCNDAFSCFLLLCSLMG